MTASVLVTFFFILNEIHVEQMIISQLNSFFSIDHNLFFLDSSVDVNRFVNNTERQGDYTPRSLYIFKNIDGNVTGLSNLNKVRNNNELLVLVPGVSDFESNLNLWQRAKELQRLSLQIKIGVFFAHMTEDDLMKLFKWAWSNRIINIFAVTEIADPTVPNSSGKLLNMFTYRPFGTFHVINVTNSTLDHFFLSQKSNFQQYQVELGEVDDWERSAKLWNTVFRVMNCSYKYQNRSIPRSDLFNNTAIDIHAKLYTKAGLNPNYIYPVEMPVLTILVPESVPYSGFLSYLGNIVSNNIIAYSSIAVIGTASILGFARYEKLHRIVILQNVADVLNLLMNDNCFIKYQRLNRIEGCIIVPLTFVGLVMMNGILSNLQSHITRPFLQHQISTVEDIYRAPFPVLTMSTKFQRDIVEILTIRTNYTDWSDKIIYFDQYVIDEQRRLFNTSIMYVTQDDAANRLIRVQKKLRIRGYRITQKGIIRSIVCYLVNEEYQFLERLNEIFHWIHSAGLYDLWLRQDDDSRGKMIIEKNHRRLQMKMNRNIKEVDSFAFPMYFVAYGWSASTTLFVGEVIWFKFLAKYNGYVGSSVQKLALEIKSKFSY